MAEDGADNNLETTTDDEQPRPQTQSARRQKNRQKTTEASKKPKCRSRIDELAIPNRRLILALYQDHANHLARDKVERIKQLLQQLYAMTPEETENYFAHLKKKSNEISQRKDLKSMLKKLVKKRNKERQYQQAYRLIKILLTKGMEYATKNQVPPLVSVRLRNLSNIILEQICDLRNVRMPNREEPDQIGSFLISVADWMAIAVEHLYYEVQLKKNRELEKIEREAKVKEKETKDKPKKEVQTNKGEGKKGEDKDNEQEDEEAVLSEALLVSEME